MLISFSQSIRVQLACHDKTNTTYCQNLSNNSVFLLAMLSQTKMQLWYPKKSEESPNRTSAAFPNKYKQKTENRQNMNNEDDHSPALSDTSEGNEEINVEFLSEDDSSRVQTPSASDCEEEVEKKRKKVDDVEVSDFIDMNYWKKETVCCGTIFRGVYDEILVDARFMKPCKNYFSSRKKKMG